MERSGEAHIGLRVSESMVAEIDKLAAVQGGEQVRVREEPDRRSPSQTQRGGVCPAGGSGGAPRNGRVR